MKVTVSVRDDRQVRAELDALGKQGTPLIVASINRVARDLSNRLVKRTTLTYNISARELKPYVKIKRANKNSVSGSVRLLIRAVPIEAFRPRVKMQKFTYEVRGKTVTRRLPAIYLRRFRDGPEKYVGPAFPLTQRRSGIIAKGERIRRRIGRDRGRLTKLRYYNFPRSFVDETLLPDVQKFVPERLALEVRGALRRRNKGGRRLLAGNE